MVRRPAVLAKKARTRVLQAIRNYGERVTVRFGDVTLEVERSPLLNEGDFRAMACGGYDVILQRFLRQNLARGDTFVDVGANVGFVSAFASSIVGPYGHVVGVEPLAEFYQRLVRLSEANIHHRLSFVEGAAGEEEGTATISLDPDGDARNATLARTDYPESRTVKVFRLDAILERYRRPERVSVVKIDVEGFELSVLKGLTRFLENFRPLIVCEIKPWEWAGLGQSAAEFRELLSRFSYTSHDLLSGKGRDIGDSFDTLVFRPNT